MYVKYEFAYIHKYICINIYYIYKHKSYICHIYLTYLYTYDHIIYGK